MRGLTPSDQQEGLTDKNLKTSMLDGKRVLNFVTSFDFESHCALKRNMLMDLLAITWVLFVAALCALNCFSTGKTVSPPETILGARGFATTATSDIVEQFQQESSP